MASPLTNPDSEVSPWQENQPHVHDLAAFTPSSNDSLTVAQHVEPGGSLCCNRNTHMHTHMGTHMYTHMLMLALPPKCGPLNPLPLTQPAFLHLLPIMPSSPWHLPTLFT